MIIDKPLDPPNKNRTTGLRDTILDAIKLFGPSGDGDVIYLITDGEDNASRRSADEVRRALVAVGIRLFAITLSEPTAMNDRTYYYPDDLDEVEEMVKATGGWMLRMPRTLDPNMPKHVKEAIRPRITAMYKQIKEFYRLELKLPTPPGRRRNWKLEIVDSTRFNKKQNVLFYQREFPTCNVD
ncbi:MAG: hypothetical protein EXQ56_00350 [Acidobacteria bacterium]|nr:hypothetical protein [Acidobacteriota bacterium]